MEKKCRNCRYWIRKSDEFGNCKKISNYIDNPESLIKFTFRCLNFERIRVKILNKYDLVDWSKEYPIDEINESTFKGSYNRNIDDLDVIIFVDDDGKSKIIKNIYQ